MIEIKFNKPVRKKDLKTFEEAKSFVKSTDIWYGYELKLDDIIDKLRFGEAVISDKDITINTNILSPPLGGWGAGFPFLYLHTTS